MMTSTDFCDRLKYMAMQRASEYNNTFPYNCCYIHENGKISADCIGLIKSLINEPSIYNRTAPVGYYVVPNQVIPDTSEIGLLSLCKNVSTDFNEVKEGSYLYMGGHAGIYVGRFEDGGICNVVECTKGWNANKITTSYVDTAGRRFNHRGGSQLGSWLKHGYLSDYIRFVPQPDIEWKKKWHLYVNDKMIKNKWYQVEGLWYLFDAYGIMLTGWAKRKNKWYYLDTETGAMVTGTKVIDGKTYTFGSDGALIE